MAFGSFFLKHGLSLLDVQVKAYEWEKDGSITALSMPVEVILQDMSVNSSPTATGESEWKGGRKRRRKRG